MKIVICGISGFVGSELKHYFEKQGDEVLALSIRSSVSVESIAKEIEGCAVIINLAGANILGRWSKSYKALLRQSRLETTAKLVEAIGQCSTPPQTLLNASAVGVYDSYHQHDESSRYFEDDFLAALVLDWESAAMRASSSQTRVCTMRFGVVYGNGGGAMAKMLPPFKMGLGGKMGDGFQMISWIYLDDLVRAVAFLIEHREIRGAVNLTSPEPISNMEQTKSMGRILHRPAFFDLPEWIVKLAFGEGSTVMLDSKEVYPRVLQEAGFKFLYPTFDSAMEQIVHTQA
jgi:uncharacterized protein (TIGR01777 family)